MKRKKKTHTGLKIFAAMLSLALIIVGSLVLLMTHDWTETYKDYDTSNSNITQYGTTLVSAHRSGGGIFPENTMMAFEGCINSETFKTDIFEFDLHITADDELIILHDSTLDRTTDAVEYFGQEDIRPENYTYEELRGLNFGESFKTDNGEKPYCGLRGDDVPDSLKVSKLDDVLDYLESNGSFDYIIEIKNGGNLGEKAADILYNTLKAKEMLDDVVVGTFNQNVTTYIDENYPDMPRSASIIEVATVYFNSLLGINKKEGTYKFSALQIPIGASILDLATARLVNYAHRHNIAVQYWTINDTETMQLLKDIGADCIMSDVPDVAYDILHT
jgi:glycerophosphoryl diester phosphodiesterase